MSVFGVDCGNLSSTVAITRAGGVDIVTNEMSKRETTSIVSFSDSERFIGEPGLDRYARNAVNTIFLVKRFIGVRVDDPHLESEKRFLTCKIKGDHTGRLLFDVMYCGEEKSFYPEQILAMLLQQLRSYVNREATVNPKFPVDVCDCVLAVPCYYNADQRRLFTQACEVAGLNCLSLINETTAAAVDYGIFRGTSLKATEEEGQVVGILDIGYGSTVFSVTKFWKGNLKTLARTFDRDCGVRDVDHLLFLHMVKVVEERYKINPLENKRAALRLRQGCERLRYLLSGNQVAHMSVENVMDVDVNIPVFERSVFEELAAPCLERLRAVVRQGLEEAGVAPADFHSVEMIGGGCRIPMFKRVVEELLNRPPSFTLNASETVARGAAITAAMFSPKFQVREFVVTELHTYPIKLAYYLEGATGVSSVPFLPDVNKVLNITGPKETYPKVLEVTIKRVDPFKVYAFYNPENALVQANVPESQYVIGCWDIGSAQPHKGGVMTEVKLRLRVFPSGLLNIETAFAVESIPADETAESAEAEKNPADEEKPSAEAPAQADAEADAGKGEDKKSGKKRQKQSRVEVTVTPMLGLIGHPGELVQDLRKHEAEMYQRDRLITATRDAKNELESYILDNRAKLRDGELQAYVTAEDRDAFIKLADEYENWLYEDGSDAELKAYQERIDIVKAIGDPAIHRRRTFEEVEFASAKFAQPLVEVRDRAAAMVGTVEHITEEELQTAIKEVDDLMGWQVQMMEGYAKQPKSDPPPITASELLEKREKVVASVNAIINRPIPAPKKQKAEAEAAPEKKPAENEEEVPAEAETNGGTPAPGANEEAPEE